MARIQYPITVNKVVFSQEEVWAPGLRGEAAGRFVAVRPVKRLNPEGKTYLGLYLGDIRVFGRGVQFEEDSGELTILDPSLNPAIFVFDLNRVVFGFQSWWEMIESEEQLRTITDEDIENVWYVKVLAALTEKDRDAT